MFQPLPIEKIKQRTSTIAIAYQPVAIVLTDGAMLIGGLAKHWHWDGRAVSIGFNTEQGKQSGHSHIVEIPVNMIADIRVIPLSKDSIPAGLPVQDYPNPLATIICRHNLQVANAYGLGRSGYVERALSGDAIPPEGIFLEDDFLLYVDWEFFSQQTSGGFSVSAGLSAAAANANLAKDLSPSLQEFVFRRLKDSWAERIRKGLSPKIIQDNLVQGCIFVPEPTEDTEIEGGKCIVTLCATNDEGDERVAYPVLMKVSCIKFPLEFLGRVNSVLTFYGELLPIPLNAMGRSYKSILLARAIAYLGTR